MGRETRMKSTSGGSTFLVEKESGDSKPHIWATEDDLSKILKSSYGGVAKYRRSVDQGDRRIELCQIGCQLVILSKEDVHFILSEKNTIQRVEGFYHDKIMSE